MSVSPGLSVCQPLLASAGQSAAIFHRQLGSLSWPPQGCTLLVSGPHVPLLISGQACVQFGEKVGWGVRREPESLQAAAKTHLQPPRALPDTQMGEMITCGSMGNTCVSAAYILF